MNRIIASLAVLTLAGTALAAGTITDGSARLDQGNAAGPFGKPLDDNSVAGTTNMWTGGPYGLFDAGMAAVRNTWSWRSTTAGGVAQSLTGTATIDSESYVGNVATIKFSNAGTSASGLFKGTLVMTLNQGATETTLNQKLTLELTNPSVGTAGSGLAIYNMIDNKLKGGHNNDALNTTAIVSGNSTGIRADDGAVYSIHSALNATKYQGGKPGDLFAAGVFTGGDLSNSIVSSSEDTATAFEWKTTLASGQPVSFETTFVVSNVPTPGAAGLMGLGLVAAGRRRR